MSEEQKIQDLNGFRAVMYMLFSIEAKLNVQTAVLIDLAEIVTQKPAGDIRNEIALKTLDEMKKLREKFVEDDELLSLINKIKIDLK